MDELNSLYYYFHEEKIMHNLVSFNQLADWTKSLKKLSKTLDTTMEESDQINDYYECLIDCSDDQATCKRICRTILA
jgi:hypothetical protein